MSQEVLIRGASAARGGPETKVLLVDSDPDESEITAYGLLRERLAVVAAANAAEALRRFGIERPDLVVVDLALAPPGGAELVRLIRMQDRTPILVVTGGSDRQDVFHCLELGADDFITKPFVFRELTLRIRAILRRAGSVLEQPAAPLVVGDLRLDPETHEVARGSHDIRLTPTEFRIFYTLANSTGHVVPASRLLPNVRGSQGGAAGSLRSHVCHLRKKLGLHGGACGSISSVAAVGYVFRASAPRDLAAHVGPAPRQVGASS